MLVLAIETATECASVVLWQDGVERAAWREVTHQDLLQRLASQVGRVMQEAHREFAHLDLVCAGLGPGSFTSLRVGLATAKGICLAHNIPLVGASSLAAMTWQTREHYAGVVCPFLDARRGEVYAGWFRAQKTGVERIVEEFVAAPTGLAERLETISEPVTVFGQVDQAPVEELAAVLPGQVQLIRDRVVLPDAGAVAYLGQQRFQECGGDDLGYLHPIYVRKSYAEEKFDIDLGLR